MSDSDTILQHSNTLNRRRPNIIFVNRFYAPDISATAQILTDVAESLASQGKEVIVYTSRSSYDNKSSFAQTDQIKGVAVRRVWSTSFGRNSAIGRSIDYLSFYLTITLTLLIALRKTDLLIAKTDPPMLSVPLSVVASLKGAMLVNWLQDVFPEVAIELGVGSSWSFFAKLLKGFRNQSLRRAEMNVVIGVRMAEAIAEMGVPRERIKIIENFVNDEQITPSSEQAPELRREWGLADSDFIVGYSGNLGRAHDLQTILSTASELRDFHQIKFLFVGSGFLHQKLKREIEAQNLNNVLLKPYQPRERLPESLALPDLHWAALNPLLEGYMVPSKVYGVLSAGRPLLMIGDRDGEIGRLVDEFNFGICVSPNDIQRAKEFILSLHNDPGRKKHMGACARKVIVNRASQAIALENWRDLVESVIERS
ncbi:MAG: glycosyltransferase family 4 protein [Pseudomonadota bacterium]